MKHLDRRGSAVVLHLVCQSFSTRLKKVDALDP